MRLDTLSTDPKLLSLALHMACDDQATSDGKSPGVTVTELCRYYIRMAQAEVDGSDLPSDDFRPPGKYDGQEEETTDKFLVHYLCPVCACYWTLTSDCTCDDDCPSCGERHVSPESWEDWGKEDA